MSEVNMENRPLVLRISGVKKMYKLGQIGGGTLQADLQSWWARKRGKEDPNVKIGQEDRARLVGQTFMALNGVSFNIHQGEAVGIIGSNGAGKSTLLKLISQVTAPTEGEIELFGRVASMLEVGTGFNGDMTGRENIYMNGAILGMTKAEIDAKMEQIIEFSEVRDFIDTPIKRYSSGMYVKLAFSVAAHLDSEIMIMDEVLAVGDMAFQKKCLTKMREAAKQEGRTVLYVSHNMNTIRQLCDRVVVLDKGKVVFDGGVEEGIRIYSGVNENDFPLHYDMDKVSRPYAQHGVKVRITSFDFFGDGEAVYNRRDIIRFSITFNSFAVYRELKLYLIIMDDSGSKIGMTQTYDSIINCNKGFSYHCIFEFNVSNLSEGIYKFTPDLFTADDMGNHYSLDHPDRTVRFRVIDDDARGLKWSDNYYGKVKLNPLHILSAGKLYENKEN